MKYRGLWKWNLSSMVNKQKVFLNLRIYTKAED